MPISMLEQIALRFETYASDQDAMAKRVTLSTKSERRAMAVRAEIWRDAAKELREIGADNREKFLKDVHEHMYSDSSEAASINDAIAKAIVDLFITPPIPAPTSRDFNQTAGRLDRETGKFTDMSDKLARDVFNQPRPTVEPPPRNLAPNSVIPCDPQGNVEPYPGNRCMDGHEWLLVQGMSNLVCNRCGVRGPVIKQSK